MSQNTELGKVKGRVSVGLEKLLWGSGFWKQCKKCGLSCATGRVLKDFKWRNNMITFLYFKKMCHSWKRKKNGSLSLFSGKGSWIQSRGKIPPLSRLRAICTIFSCEHVYNELKNMSQITSSAVLQWTNPYLLSLSYLHILFPMLLLLLLSSFTHVRLRATP